MRLLTARRQAIFRGLFNQELGARLDGLWLSVQGCHRMNTPLSKAERDLMAKIGRRGGEARKRNLSPKRLKEIARMGGKARQAKRNGNGS